MALRYFHKRCEVHGLYVVRRPVRAFLNASIKVEEIIAVSFCVQCHPERLHEVCGGCLLPLKLLRGKKYGSSGFHAQLCFTCYQRERRARLALQRPAA
jgi:hypothetical protein